MAAIRPAVEGEAQVIWRMVREAGLDPTSIRWQNFLVAEEDGKIVGIGQIRRHPGCEELGSLRVLEAYQGQGIATQLVTALEARAGRPLYLFCLKETQGFYARFGYRRIGWWNAPPYLRLKMLIPLTFRLAGMVVILMRKD